MAEQGTGIPYAAIVSAARFLTREKQSYSFLQPDLPAFFLCRQALEFKFLRVPRISEFLRAFFRLLP